MIAIGLLNDFGDDDDEYLSAGEGHDDDATDSPLAEGRERVIKDVTGVQDGEDGDEIPF